MSIRWCVLLWARPGRQDALAAYEDQVTGLLPDHGGRVLSRVRGDGGHGHPVEVHVVEFSSRAGLDSYLADPRRAALADDREAAVERTQLFPVDLVDSR